MTERPVRVCVVGSCNLDLTFRVARLPRPGETVAAHALAQGFGGKGANQAVAAARLGARVSLVGRVGDDGVGRQYREHLAAEGVDPTFVHADPHQPTGTASIYVDAAGENSIVVALAANGAVSPADVIAAADAIQRADVLLCQLETPLDVVLEALRVARAAGVRTVLNPAPAAELPDELLRLCDVCVPNETELQRLTGQPAGEAAARALQRRGPASVVVTLGAAGALALDAAADHVPGLRVDAVDPTGAGDVFTAALAVALAEGSALRAAVGRANVAAALSVTRPGAQVAAPMRAEVDARCAAQQAFAS